MNLVWHIWNYIKFGRTVTSKEVLQYFVIFSGSLVFTGKPWSIFLILGLVGTIKQMPKDLEQYHQKRVTIGTHFHWVLT